ncbi:hypothetical protein TWF718_005237 [Orbilia javanica]|uniref:CBM1 domain-containing protein n=1 Tax=Orbilia javanica TaxID=47235 RepID=A0AAN8N3A8_9PEZI
MRSQVGVLFALQAVITAVAAQALPGVWQQCDGIGWNSDLKGQCQPGLLCTTYNAYYAQCIPAPTPTTTPPTTTSYRSRCCGATKTDCRTYCLGQTPPVLHATTVTCSCPPKTGTSILVVPPPVTTEFKKRQEYVTTTCPMETYYTTYALCCGASGTATGSVCKGSRRTTIDHPIPRCVICTNTTTTCPMETYYTTYPLCCGASGTESGSVCSGSRRTSIPHPVVRCASCTTGYPVATAVITKIDVVRVG